MEIFRPQNPLSQCPPRQALFAFGPILGAAVIILYAPETKGMTLEEIQEKLSVSGKAGQGVSSGKENSVGAAVR